MQTATLNEAQSKQLCDEIGEMLLQKLDTETVHNQVDKHIDSFLKKNNIQEKPENVSRKLSWSVKVTIKG